jgi:Restriction endonuclease
MPRQHRRSSRPKRINPDWQEFERLVTRIEGALAPEGAVVKSPDWIQDKETGKKREVDGSIRANLGTVPILITIECRKRQRRQDIAWIEQLITKKQKIVAEKTIAVSSSDISEPAKTTATLNGIEFRRISEVTEDAMRSWLKIKEIEHVIFHVVITAIAPLECYSEPNEHGKLHNSVAKPFQADPLNTQIFTRRSNQKAVSVNSIFIEAIRRGLDLYSEVPLDGTKFRKNVAITFAKGVFNVLTEQGLRDLARLILSMDVYISARQTIPVPKAGFSYTGPHGTVDVIEAKTELFGNPVIVSFYKAKDSDIQRFAVTTIRKAVHPKEGSEKRSVNFRFSSRSEAP